MNSVWKEIENRNALVINAHILMPIPSLAFVSDHSVCLSRPACRCLRNSCSTAAGSAATDCPSTCRSSTSPRRWSRSRVRRPRSEGRFLVRLWILRIPGRLWLRRIRLPIRILLRMGLPLLPIRRTVRRLLVLSPVKITHPITWRAVFHICAIRFRFRCPFLSSHTWLSTILPVPTHTKEQSDINSSVLG